MITKNITKIIVAVALTLAVTFSTGAWEDITGLATASSAHACDGGTMSDGGGC